MICEAARDGQDSGSANPIEDAPSGRQAEPRKKRQKENQKSAVLKLNGGQGSK